MLNRMQNFLSYRGQTASLKTEIIAGITTFLTMMYIIVVNPAILSKTGMPYSGVLTATVLIAALSSVLMGLYAKNPIALAPGMGINAFFAYTAVLQYHIPWQTALGAVFWSGIIFIVLSILNVRSKIVAAFPQQLRYGMSCGIGLFITYLGLQAGGLIVANPTTLTTIGTMNSTTLTFLVGFILAAVLVFKRVKGALIIAIVTTTIVAIPIGRWWGSGAVYSSGQHALVVWKGVFAEPDFSTFFQLNFVASLKLSVLPVTFTLLFVDLFDSLATFVGVAGAGDLLDETGNPRNLKQSLIVDAISSAISGLFGSSPGTSYIESATGIEEGGRTGLTAIVTGLLFLPFMFLSPLLSIIPSIATAPALLIVGVFMMKQITQINWQQFDDAIPAFLIVVIIPLANSITQGIIWGFLAWTVIKWAVGKRHEVSKMLLLIDAFAILLLVLQHR